MPGALEGIRIVDLTWGIAGPLAVMQLADHGADVVKVEPPGGDPFRAHAGSVVWLRGRRSLVLDLRDAQGREVFLRLLERADVLVESFRPGVMDRLGLGYEDLSPRFPRLVYCSLSAYPPGHRAASRPGYDALVQARSGLQWEQPGWREGPIFLHLPVPSMAAQFLVQLGITAALLVREHTGRGQHVRTSLYQGALLFTTMLWQFAERADAGYHGVMAKTHPPGVHQATIHECARGEWIHASTMTGLPPKASLEEVLGLEDAPDFATLLAMSPEDRAAHEARVREAFRQQDRDQLVERLHAANLGAEAIVPPEAMFDHPQLRANETFATVEDPDHGTTTQVGVVVRLSETPGHVDPARPRPRPGQHSRELLAELGYPPAEVQALLAKGVVEDDGNGVEDSAGVVEDAASEGGQG